MIRTIRSGSRTSDISEVHCRFNDGDAAGSRQFAARFSGGCISALADMGSNAHTNSTDNNNSEASNNNIDLCIFGVPQGLSGIHGARVALCVCESSLSLYSCLLSCFLARCFSRSCLSSCPSGSVPSGHAAPGVPTLDPRAPQGSPMNLVVYAFFFPNLWPHGSPGRPRALEFHSSSLDLCFRFRLLLSRCSPDRPRGPCEPRAVSCLNVGPEGSPGDPMVPQVSF